MHFKKWKVALLAMSIFALTMAGCDNGGGGPVESWPLNDGGTGTAVASELENGAVGENTWGIWLKSETFGRVLDFSTAGSHVYIPGSQAQLKNSFSISAWIMAPVREEGDRVILMQGAPTEGAAKLDGFRLYLDGDNDHALAFEASGLTGTENSGVSLTDGKWHHVLVSCSGGSLTYYIDGEAVKTVSVSGEITASTTDLFIGSDTAGECGFDGSMAQVRIYQTGKKPAEVTDTVLNEADNTPQRPRMDMHRGIVIDRRQYFQPEPLPSEGQTVTEADIINCKNMGFDHVKLLLTPNHLIREDGSLIRENMAYITRVVDYVKDNDFRCILCIHPEGNFKMVYLKNLDNFEVLLKWYGELAEYIGEHWDADTVALQLMTEPGENNRTVSWSWQSDRMYGAVRNVLPDHTILTSSDRYGNLEQLKLMSPATDSNLIYTFTTYEPYTIGWYYYGTTSGQKDAWGYVHDIPYPVEEGVDYTDAIENAIDLVPDSLKEGIRQELWAYVRGEYDGRRTDMPNNYDSLYNAQWHMLRAKSLDDWRQRYGGNIHIMCVEFGCMDAITPVVLWESAVPGSGISSEDRLQFTEDMRSAFDAYDIGWSYWSYNEAHTIFRPEVHTYGVSPDPESARNMFDYDMLTRGLGVTPLVSPDEGSGGPDVVIDPDWLVIDMFESVGNWYGDGVLELRRDGAPYGNAYLAAATRNAEGGSVFAAGYQTPIDASAYADGYAHLWIYVEDVSKLTGGQVELCNGTGPDVYETSWDLQQYVTQNGWNEVYLPFSEAGQGVKPADLSAINYVRIYFLQSEDGVVGLDAFYLCHEKGGGQQSGQTPEGETLVISPVEEISPWYGTGLEIRGGAPAGGSYLLAATQDGAGSAVFAASVPAMDLSGFQGGKIRLWLYVEDLEKVQGGELELTSSGAPDAEELSWEIAKYLTQSGWNEVVLPLSEANAVGTADLSRINYIRLYVTLSSAADVGFDDLKIEK